MDAKGKWRDSLLYAILNYEWKNLKSTRVNKKGFTLTGKGKLNIQLLT